MIPSLTTKWSGRQFEYIKGKAGAGNSSLPCVVIAEVRSVGLRDTDDCGDNYEHGRENLNSSMPREPSSGSTEASEEDAGGNENHGTDTSDCGW